MHLDWSLALCLTAVAWFDALYRLPRDAIVLRRSLGRPWIVLGDATSTGSTPTILRWAPFSLTIVFRAPETAGAPPHGLVRRANHILGARFARVRWTLLLLRALGIDECAFLLAGIPLLAMRYGGWGLRAGIATVIALTAGIFAVTVVSLRHQRLPLMQAVRRAAPILSPFAAPRGFDIAYEHAVTGVPRLLAIRYLMGQAAFSSWIRPWAYDAVHGNASAESRLATEARAVLDAKELSAIIRAEPSVLASNESYCPRCATTYLAGATACHDCNGLALVGAGSPLA